MAEQDQNALALSLVEKLHEDPSTRTDFLKLVKKANPKAYIAELDAAEPLNHRIDSLTKNVEQLVGYVAQERVDRDIEKRRTRLKTERDYTDEGIDTLEKWMIENRVGDHFIAADALEARQPKAKPERPSFRPRAFFDETKDDGKQWLDDPEGTADRMLDEALSEIANGSARW